MNRLQSLLRYLWADFDDEVSFTLTRDRVKGAFSTSLLRFAVYGGVFLVITFALLGLCNVEVFAPTRDPTPTP